MGSIGHGTTRSCVRAALLALLALGAGLRVWASTWDPPLHPDEYFQYVEPAWWHMTGAGAETWEWRDGIRSWVLPFYNGAWIALFSLVGIESGAVMAALLKGHWALINSLLILLAYQGGRRIAARLEPTSHAALTPHLASSGLAGGFIAASLCCVFPPLILLAGHTLSELPSMLCLVAGLVLTVELAVAKRVRLRSRRAIQRAALAGVLLSLGACLRIANGPAVLFAPVALLVSRRHRELLALLVGALVPALLFGVADWITWGSFASSFTNYVRFNFIEGKAAEFGSEPPTWYLEKLYQAAPVTLLLLTPLALWGVRASWPYLATAALIISYLSAQEHKELRFVIAVWPLLLIAAGGAAGAVAARLMRRLRGATRRRAAVGTAAAYAGCGLLIAVVVQDAAGGPAVGQWLDAEQVAAVAWIGEQPDLTGFMTDDAYAVSGLQLGSRAPRLQYDPALLDNPMVSHLLVAADSQLEREARSAGFEIVRRAGRHVIMNRADQEHGADAGDENRPAP